jgi:hypothetical protein
MMGICICGNETILAERLLRGVSVETSGCMKCANYWLDDN